MEQGPAGLFQIGQLFGLILGAIFYLCLILFVALIGLEPFQFHSGPADSAILPVPADRLA